MLTSVEWSYLEFFITFVSSENFQNLQIAILFVNNFKGKSSGPAKNLIL